MSNIIYNEKSKENQVKTCSKCGVEKSVDEFYGRKLSKDGLHPQCKECILEYHSIKRKEKPHNVIHRFVVGETKTCGKCGVEKSTIKFSKDRSAEDGLGEHCKQCKKIDHDSNVGNVKGNQVKVK